MICNPESSDVRRQCIVCYKIETPDDLGISCGQGHYLHGEECLHNFFADCLQEENWTFKLPMKCAICNEELLTERVIALMTPEEHEKYIEGILYSQAVLKDDEEFIRCSFCRYGAIYTKSNIPLFFFCLGEKCGKMSCNICHKECEHQEYLDLDEYEEGDFGDTGIHFKCEEYSGLKKEIEEVLTEGSTNKCPSCGYRGRKDDACTHMTCMRCDQEWCYCCEKKKEELSLPAGQEYFGHQYEWEENKKRCPLYLEDFSEMDLTWPENSEECVLFYHRQKTLYMLQKKLEKLDKDLLAKVLNHFPALFNGYTLEEIQTFKLNDLLQGRIKETV